MEISTLDAPQVNKQHSEFTINKKRKRRGSYCESNAELLRPFFDKVIETPHKELCLPYRYFQGCTPNTCYVKTNDALKYLCENELDDISKARYIMLRAQYKVSPESIGIAMRRKVNNHLPANINDFIYDTASKSGQNIPDNSFASNPVAEVLPIKATDETPVINLSWKDKINEFVSNAKCGDQLNLAPFAEGFTNADKGWVGIQLDDNTSIEYLFMGKELRMIKV